jgi:negative regulator of genetic competence, sporulation and motility
MELKLVNENKLKIVLTNEDMALMDITFEEMDYNEDVVTRRVLWEILDKAKRQTGFDVGTENLYINVHSDKNGGCLIYVTKDTKKSVLHTHTYEKKYKTKFYTGIKKKRLLYVFDNSEVLIEVCNQLSMMNYNGKSDIYADDKKYYLYIEDNIDFPLDSISEYGVLINNPLFSFYLDEHTKKILAADAVKKFSEIFS